MRRHHLAVIALGWTLAACAGAESPIDGGRVAVSVAPLSLPGVTDAEYTVTVRDAPNGGGEVVWTKDVTSSAYGDGGGSLSLVGPCDADAGINTITLELTALRDGAGILPTSDYMNPTPVSLEAACAPNADVAVTFDLTVARRAQQGFFDVAVSFGDVFCSAKLDCLDDDGGDLELLHDPDSHARDLTAVIGFACTGSVTGATWLYMNDPVVSCTGLAPDLVTVDASGQGNLDLDAAPNANPGGYLFAASVFKGAEGLANTAYWNISLGLREAAFGAAGDCTLTLRATASDQELPQEPGGFPLPAGSVYPVIDWSVPLSSATGRECERHEVNATDSGVETHYVGYLPALNTLTWSPTPIAFKHRLEQSTGELVTACGVGCPAGWCDLDGVCATCSDGAANGDETDVDCGGSACAGCADGLGCDVHGDCASAFCGAGVCGEPSCSDGFANGDETDVDCGGPDCDPCGVGLACDTVTDCVGGLCGVGTGGTCATSTCFDGAPIAGGAVLTCVRDGGSTYEVQTFTSVGSSTFVAPAGVSAVDVLVVAGGGGGGGSAYALGGGGGGGAGGLRYATGVAVTGGQSYAVTVGGGGGAGSGGPGGNGAGSSALGYAATGGGGGGSGNTGGVPSSGGSGGGAGYNGYYYRAGASGIAGQGHAGGYNNCSNWAAGGGGAGGAGENQLSGSCGVGGGRPVNGGLGGVGLSYDITGVSRTYATGGNGSIGGPTDGTAGAAATGDGGCGIYAASNGGVGGAGGSGIVVIRYPAP